MSFRVRPALLEDIDSLCELAELAGGGLTSLPADRAALGTKLAQSADSFAKRENTPGPDTYLLVLENVETGQVRGTVQLFSKVGPLYSYRVGVLRHASRELNRSYRTETLSLTTDHEGVSKAGGLFLHPCERKSGLGLLLYQAKHLFIRRHRARFPDRTIAEMRGISDENGRSPFWDALAGKFFDMGFVEADLYHAVHGSQFIADLMPKHPIYTAMLPDEARRVMGQPHPATRPAMRMAEKEGYVYDGYVHIFDGGPTLAVQTDGIHAIRDAKDAVLTDLDPKEGRSSFVATGSLLDYLCVHAKIREHGDGVAIDAQSASNLRAKIGGTVTYIER